DMPSLYRCTCTPRPQVSFPTRRSSDLGADSNADTDSDVVSECEADADSDCEPGDCAARVGACRSCSTNSVSPASGAALNSSCIRSEEHTSEVQSRENLVCRLLLEKKNT